MSMPEEVVTAVRLRLKSARASLLSQEQQLEINLDQTVRLHDGIKLTYKRIAELTKWLHDENIPETEEGAAP